jgi:hypothetical protein
MPSKLFVHVESENHFFGPTDFVEVCRLPIEVGRSYLVQARGLAGLEAGSFMTVRLELRRFGGGVISSTESNYINHSQQFVLTATGAVPAEGGAGSGPPPPGPSVTLLVKTFWIQHEPGHSVGVVDTVLTALTVDEIVPG